MKLGTYKVTLMAVGLIGVLLLASPALGFILRFPSGEQFSELYLLGPTLMLDGYPSTLNEAKNYLVYAAVTNHLGSSAYYVLYVKFGNEADLSPNPSSGNPSPLQTLYESRFFLADGGTWQDAINFSISGVVYPFSNENLSSNQSTVGSITINGVSFEVDKPAAWDANASGFYYQLIFELSLYNPRSGSIEYDNRYASLWLHLG